MKKSTWKKHHKWFGLIFAFFIILFGASGIVLNHRQLFSDYQISRKWLPDAYRYKSWNNGMLRGTLSCPPGICQEDSAILLFGNAGTPAQVMTVLFSDICGDLSFNAAPPQMPRRITPRWWVVSSFVSIDLIFCFYTEHVLHCTGEGFLETVAYAPVFK